MIISNIYNINFPDIEEKYDLFIGVAGDEPRSYYTVRKTNILQKAKKKYVFPYRKESKKPMDYPDDVIWIPEAIDAANPLWDIVEYHLIDNPHNISIIIDYSSMSRILYGSFLKSCYEYGEQINIKLCLIYNIAHPCPPPKTQSFHFDAMPDYLHLGLPQKPTALIIGLGYEEGRAYSLKDYFDAEVVYIFRTDKKSSNEYYELVNKNNDKLLRKLSKNGDTNIFEYSLDNVGYTHKMLSDLCKELSNKYRVVIAPCGPKPFTLISLLVALQSDNVDIWRIHNVGNVVEKQSSEKNIVTIIEMIPTTNH